MALITDFLPYFYIAVPRGFQDEDMTAFKGYLNVGQQESCFVCSYSNSEANRW